jgi:cytochrome c peroxidase
MFWDSRVRSLERQALEPLQALEEMRGTAYSAEVAVDSVVARLRAVPEYVVLFEGAFAGASPISATQLAQALAAFQRSLIAMDSPFDRFRAGDSTALTEQQLRGQEEFDDAGCDRCHEGVMFSDFDQHAEGVPEHPLVAEPDTGDGRFRFRTPSLRNVALTAPYMHNGMLATLEDVLVFYDEGRSRNPNVADRRRRDEERRVPRVDRQFRGVDDMSDREMRAIIAFLEALTDPSFDRTVPVRVPSGLPPGGLIHGGG